MGCGFSMWPFSSGSGDMELDFPESYGHLSTELSSKNIVISAEDIVTGEGTVLSDSALVQTKCYWEVTILKEGLIQLGVTADSKASYDTTLSSRKLSWSMDFAKYKVGTTIGITYDLSSVRPQLKFFLEGREIPSPARLSPNGDVHPAIYIGSGASVQCNFGNIPFKNKPSGFEGLMCSMDLL